MDLMVIAELLCSDEQCAVEIEVVVDSLDELDLLVCEECECVLQTLSISDVECVELELPPPIELPRAA